MNGLLLSDDLIFTSRVTATARVHGLDLRAVKTPAAILAAAAVSAPSGVILDLHGEDLDLPELLRRLREICPAMPNVVGYGSHVDAARLSAAREAGCDLVLPRSAFVAKLETDLATWLRSEK